MKAALPALVSILALAACVPATTAPVAAPAPVARPAPAPTRAPAPPPVQVQVSDNWMDSPATPGDWRYADQSGGGVALFSAPGGEPLFMLECDRETGPGVMLVRPGGSGRMIIIRTETAAKGLPLTAPGAGQRAWLTPGDPLLDAMALSKGRFAVEAEGLPTLYLPSHAEVSRVIEDCR